MSWHVLAGVVNCASSRGLDRICLKYHEKCFGIPYHEVRYSDMIRKKDKKTGFRVTLKTIYEMATTKRAAKLNLLVWDYTNSLYSKEHKQISTHRN